jgi:ubiquinone/menaquinone biosynthesis C-methylase UbiE
VDRRWADCDRNAVARRYNRIAKFIPLFDRLLFLPRDMRQRAVARLDLRRGDSVLEIGCGTGNSLAYLRDAVGPQGHVCGVDISAAMLRRARKLCEANRWRNVEVRECDGANYLGSKPLGGVLFSLSYNTMPHHRAVLRNAWDQLRPGGRLVIMDAKVPGGLGGEIALPFGLWLMKHTLLGNPLIHPWQELAAIAESIDMSEYLFGCYYICRGMKPLAGAAPLRPIEADNDNVLINVDAAHRIPAE